MSEHEAAAAFARRYEAFWHDGASDPAKVYSADAILCGYEIVRSTARIGSLLQGIFEQGWREIAIEIVETASIADTILLACRYTARSADSEQVAKSSYVLRQDGDIWKAIMHTAT